MATVTVRINGMEYNLKGKEDEAYLKNIADYVEKKLQEILEKNKKLSISAASVLTAINLADEAFKSNKDYDELLSNFENLQIANKSLKEELRDIKEDSTFKFDKQEQQYEQYIDSLRQELERIINAKEIIEEEKRVLESEKEYLNQIKLALEESLKEEQEKTKSNSDEEKINELLNEVTALKEQLNIMEEENKKNISEKETLKKENKELKFNVQSCKYKIIDLEKKFLDSQMTVVKERVKSNPLIKPKK
ncbi:cell division protein ZapA [Clostridium massiliamazoniense]|uniref:cell division protein ZapA n=1 Tax=Clostridium massiliamazoniense TaxID=1347366 RepID=UPI0006D8270E|nr:cell division protein ZapA [Clostridium massiliamazoniense]